MTIVLPQTAAVEAYDSIAPFYDRFTAHHDYELWTDGLLRLARRHGLAGGRALDAGCGSGKSLLPLIARGFEVTGCDASAGMLELAAEKAPPGTRLLCEDLRSLGPIGEFDLITCLDDVANYLGTPEDLTAALRGLAANLAPGGVLVFDANTLATYRSFFTETAVVEEPGLVMVWRGLSDADLPARGRARATFDAFHESDGTWARSTSEHEQRHHPEPLIRSCLAEAGLRCLAVYGQDPAVNFERELDELRHTKAVYVATPGREVTRC